MPIIAAPIDPNSTNPAIMSFICRTRSSRSGWTMSSSRSKSEFISSSANTVIATSISTTLSVLVVWK